MVVLCYTPNSFKCRVDIRTQNRHAVSSSPPLEGECRCCVAGVPEYHCFVDSANADYGSDSEHK